MAEAARDVSSGVAAPVAEPRSTDAEERISVASQWQLMWWRFREHRLALASGIVIGIFYLVVLLADFLAYADPEASEAERGLIPPQPIHLFDEDQRSLQPSRARGGRTP